MVSSTLAASRRASALAQLLPKPSLGKLSLLARSPCTTRSVRQRRLQRRCRHTFAHGESGVEPTSWESANYALASAELRSAPHHGDFVADSRLNRSWPYAFIALAIPSATA
jgi:hypothetical protein